VKKESFGLYLKTAAAVHLILALLFVITAKQENKYKQKGYRKTSSGSRLKISNAIISGAETLPTF
jgi:hypothetical protein